MADCKITFDNNTLIVPDNPVIPFIEGDGTGPDIWAASVRVFDAAVAKAYNGKKKITWHEVLAGRRPSTKRANGCPRPRSTPSTSTGWGSRGRSPRRSAAGSQPERGPAADPGPVCLPAPGPVLQRRASPGQGARKGRHGHLRENTEDIYAGIEFKEGSRRQPLQKLVRRHLPDLYKKVRFPETTGFGIKPSRRRAPPAWSVPRSSTPSIMTSPVSPWSTRATS
jgi:isocitrate dehydrogenase